MRYTYDDDPARGLMECVDLTSLDRATDLAQWGLRFQRFSGRREIILHFFLYFIEKIWTLSLLRELKIVLMFPFYP